MNQREKNEMTVWSVVGILAVTVIVGTVYINRHAGNYFDGDYLNEIAPAAGSSEMETETPMFRPTSPVENPAEPQPTYP